MTCRRDYDREIEDTPERLYAYKFDTDVMHPFIIRAFSPFFNPGSALELGSYKGHFTKLLSPHFDRITCVEASTTASEYARRQIGTAEFIVENIEEVMLLRRFNNIFLVHVLEHLDDAVAVLRRINEEWLAEGGRLFLACPNGNAPSRQIAVKMGKISHNTAVTAAEAEHGHKRTYTLDTLERDAVAGGLTILYCSGSSSRRLQTFNGTACCRLT